MSYLFYLVYQRVSRKCIQGALCLATEPMNVCGHAMGMLWTVEWTLKRDAM
jgi:hypothetical protein